MLERLARGESAALSCFSDSGETIPGFWRQFFPFLVIRASKLISITGPFFRRYPVLFLPERELVNSLHLLHLLLGPAFDGQAAALYPDAAPMLALLSFPNFYNFVERERDPLLHRIPRRCYHYRLSDTRFLPHHIQHLDQKTWSSCCRHLSCFLLVQLYSLVLGPCYCAD